MPRTRSKLRIKKRCVIAKRTQAVKPRLVSRTSWHRAYICRFSSLTIPVKFGRFAFGGDYDDSVGFYVQPTLIETTDPKDKLMREEIFGPVITVYVYDDKKYDDTVELLDQTSNFGLTGSIFCQDKKILDQTRERLINAAGNLYLNDKSTGSIVNQQPFGGARLSGTNDKAGGPHYLFRFSSPLSIKDMKEPVKTFKHVSME